MGYWDKKSEEEVETREKPDLTLEEYEVLAEVKAEDAGKYLSRKMTEHKDRFEKVTSDGYWFAVYFNNDAQKEEFLEKINLEKNCRYIPGKEFAKKCGITISTPNFDFGEEKKPVKEFKERARPIYEGSDSVEDIAEEENEEE